MNKWNGRLGSWLLDKDPVDSGTALIIHVECFDIRAVEKFKLSAVNVTTESPEIWVSRPGRGGFTRLEMTFPMYGVGPKGIADLLGKDLFSKFAREPHRSLGGMTYIADVASGFYTAVRRLRELGAV